jgi:hypothetical protein
MGMRRLVALAISVAALASPAGLWAQRGGGGHSSGGSHSGGFSRGFSSFRSSPAPVFHSSPSPVFRPGPSSARFTGARPGSVVRRRPVGGGFFPGGRRYGYYPYYGYGSPYGYGYYIPSSLSYVGFPSDYQSDQAGAEADAEGPQGYYPPEDELAGQVQQLGDEVAQLQQGQAYDGGGPPGAAPAEPLLPTVLVYRDGHKMEVQNYAIYGQTVWVFGDQITRKVAFADLDLDGTKKLNDQRGVEFDIPASR